MLPAASLFLLALGCGIAIVYGSLVPLNYRPLPWEETLARFRETPVLNISVGGRADWLANLFIYIPFGFLLTLSGCRLSSVVVWRIFVTLLAILVGAAVAVAVEMAQLWFPPRTVSQNDIQAEIIGTVVGSILALVASIAGLAILTWVRPLQSAIFSKWGLTYLAALTIYSVMPGDLVISWDELWLKLTKKPINWIPFADFDWSKESFLSRAFNLFCYFPVGYLAAQWKRRDDWISSAAIAAWLGGCYAMAMEIVQLPIYSRETTITAVLVGAFGAALGGACQNFFLAPERRPRWLIALLNVIQNPAAAWLAVALFAAVIAVVMLAPFTIIQDPEVRASRWDGFFRVPFAALYVSTEFGALTSILRKGAVFAILGGLIRLAMGGSKRASGTIAIWLGVATFCACFGVAIEMAQVVIDAHQPDGTDVLIYTASALVGFRLVDLQQALRLSVGGMIRT